VDHPSTSSEETTAAVRRLAERALARYDMPPSVDLSLINVSENTTFRVDAAAGGKRWALRVHREGYHPRRAIASELCWLKELDAGRTVCVPRPVTGKDGELIQTLAVEGLAAPRNVVLFEWEAGTEPSADDVAGYERLGEAAARMHAHVRRWRRPRWFERLTWDFETTIGDTPHWGGWRDGPGMTPEIESAVAETVAVIGHRLERIGKGPEVFNLVHGDMRLANLLVDDGVVKVIDFDDSGFSWFLYDCATTVSFFEERPEVADLVDAWVRGYRRIGRLSVEEHEEIATFVMLRRILLVAWIGSHSETELARTMGEAYTAATLPLCERYLSKFGETRFSRCAASANRAPSPT